MKRILSALALIPVASAAQAQGPIATAQRGAYVCEMPGTAAGKAGYEQPERSFRIESASRYSAPQGGGTYLLRGDRIEFTSGPRKGEAYQVIRAGFLRAIGADGSPGRLRCVQQGS
ncbi:elongation factor P [Altererythrobacter soli]|uniref:Elongation factor P n=1 Tax=Croceibacterium soli TaxID=1739690 RepID=A0A6I4UTA7_9SPHN|nr:elongation factor P [Croceibacterium soli]MXP40843.1 elongation factor P [Croceibacterium soli]